MYQDYYVYPAILEWGGKNEILVQFPNFQTVSFMVKSQEEAIQQAKEYLALQLYELEREKKQIPLPLSIEQLTLHPKQVVIMVEILMTLYREAIGNRSIRKTLTIPQWLDDLALAYNLNFSHVLQEALKEKLGVSTIEPSKRRKKTREN